MAKRDEPKLFIVGIPGAKSGTAAERGVCVRGVWLVLPLLVIGGSLGMKDGGGIPSND